VYAIKCVQVTCHGLHLIGTYQLLHHADDVGIFEGSTCAIKITEALLAANIEVGLEQKSDKIRYMFIVRKCRSLHLFAKKFVVHY
jgi:hypothetical protein